MTVETAIQMLREKDIIIPNEWIIELEEVMEKEIASNSLTAICKVIGVWKKWMINPSPEEMGKIAAKALKSLAKIKCSSFNILPTSKSNIKNLVDMSKYTPDIVTIINENSTVIYIDDMGRKEIV